MRKMSPHRIVFLIILCLLATPRAQAGSIFSINGPGEFIYTADARLRAMGGGGLALTQEISGSLVNPALLGGLKLAAVTISFRPEALYVSDAVEKNVLTSLRLHNFALNLPVGKGLGLALDLRQQSDFNFKMYQETSILDKAYTKSVAGSGGTSLVSLSLARNFGSSLYLGVRLGYVFGKTTKSWKGIFDDTDYRSTWTTREIENTGTQLGGGIAFQLDRRFSVGAIFTAAHDIEQKEEWSSSFSHTVIETSTLEYPLTIGLGLAFRPNAKLTAEFDVTATKWSDLKIDGQPAPDFTDVLRVSAGCEFVPHLEQSASYISRIPLRLGYNLEPWHLKPANGKKIYAHFLTMGIGLPFGRLGGRLDASLELGLRGNASSVGAEEKIIRGTLSLWGFEPWFQRRK